MTAVVVGGKALRSKNAPKMRPKGETSKAPKAEMVGKSRTFKIPDSV